MLQSLPFVGRDSASRSRVPISWRGGATVKLTSSKTAVTLFDLAMLASIGLVSAGAFYGILRLAIWLAVQ